MNAGRREISGDDYVKTSTRRISVEIGLLRDGVELRGSNYRRLHATLFEVRADVFKSGPLSFPQAANDWGRVDAVALYVSGDRLVQPINPPTYVSVTDWLCVGPLTTS